MESNDDGTNKDKIDTRPPVTKGKKVKKKSAIAKLAEKRRQSESGSEFGSTTSLRSNTSKVITDNNTTNVNLDGKQDLKVNSSSDKKDIEIFNLKRGDNSGTSIRVTSSEGKHDTLLSNLDRDTLKKPEQSKLNSLNPTEDFERLNVNNNSSAGSSKVDDLDVTNKPIPRPRNYKVLSDASEISPTNYMDIDSDGEDKNKKVEDDIVSNKAPSDATVRRFRALKVANQRSESLESLKNSPFVPKPPDTPKSGRRHSKYKGEKRNRDPNSSGEEQDSSKAKKQDNIEETMSTDEVFVNDKLTGSKANLKESDVQMSPGRDSHIGSEVDLAQITENYKHALHSDTGSYGKLPPLSPKSHPPPLPSDVTSRTLRTAYKSDRKPDKPSFDSISNRSSVSSAMMMPISIKEARAR